MEKSQPSPGYSLITPDFPGFGQTPLASELSFSEAAEALENCLTEKGITGPIVLGGISMGGYWAMEYYRLYPKRISSLLFISTRSGIDRPEARQNRLNIAEKVVAEGTDFLLEFMVPGLLGRTTLIEKPDIRSQLNQWIKQTSPQAIALAQRTMANRRNQNELTKEINVPTLVIAGREDALIPLFESEALVKSIRNSQLKVIERAGHLLPIEKPETFQKVVDNFLQELE